MSSCYLRTLRTVWLSPALRHSSMFWKAMPKRGRSVYSSADSSLICYDSCLDIQTIFTLCLKFKVVLQLRLHISLTYFFPLVLSKPLSFHRLESFLPRLTDFSCIYTLSSSGIPVCLYFTPYFCIIISFWCRCVLTVLLTLGQYSLSWYSVAPHLFCTVSTGGLHFAVMFFISIHSFMTSESRLV